ncbi:3-hydroxybenzoate 6-monooxygenase [Streptomyces alkaliterrae]|uniref:3-hydroxybenzoate 6-monooxygenase n=1 Tax=Streptomyces alkaliterrae TaxID=2213162 RepID=A0A5P0YZI5_9ACTN|nr:3-hydroxybenzoate 6-monooxygenase [Streptomyces alkaliterrae]MBB1256465.1 3-hydroxybenzoate 6-monooxygenase [Streptomyces alkaliterrae]MBB1261652.1 3-hydroxybenzoate 6-monooxygenase [Streptomyces alkaliterrae]MQS05072.1 3-hydroxybenzoate 6-monooxygenase [Streptomyces alkaliterrae]
MVHALVAGGGIGGLATALSLARHGHRVTVLERAEAFAEIGAGIQLGPNAFHALDVLGVGRQVREQAVFVDELRLMDGTSGGRLVAVPLTERYRRRFGNPYAVVHRTDLHQPLLTACREAKGVELLAGTAVRRYEQNASGVTAETLDGRRHHGELLVGADGLRSTVRARLVGDGPPRVSGHTIYRSVIPIDRVPPELRWNTVTLWAGPNWHFVHYLIAGGRYLNLAATLDDGAREPVTGRPRPREWVLGRFPGTHPTPRRLLELGEEWREWVLCDRDPVPDWTDGRVTLAGDAAHPMLQYAAQGACQALEDAVVLGEELDGASADGVPSGLRRYNTRRHRRTARAQLLAREMGVRLYHASGRAARARDTLLRTLSEDDLHHQVAWLHGDRDFTDAGDRPAPSRPEPVGR